MFSPPAFNRWAIATAAIGLQLVGRGDGRALSRALASSSIVASVTEHIVTMLCTSQWDAPPQVRGRCRRRLSTRWMRLGASRSTVRILPGRPSPLGISHSKWGLYGAFVWVRRARNSPKRRFLARCRHRELLPRVRPPAAPCRRTFTERAETRHRHRATAVSVVAVACALAADRSVIAHGFGAGTGRARAASRRCWPSPRRASESAEAGGAPRHARWA